jgi:nucleoside-diphosphate-sugar epimerase
MPTFYFQAARGDPITVYGNGLDTRDYVYIDDTVRGLWLARKLPAGEAVNLATGRAATNLEVAKLIKELVKSESEIIFVKYPEAFGGIRHQIGSYEKARESIRWEPETSLKEGLGETINWLSQMNLEEDNDER